MRFSSLLGLSHIRKLSDILIIIFKVKEDGCNRLILKISQNDYRNLRIFTDDHLKFGGIGQTE